MRRGTRGPRKALVGATRPLAWTPRFPWATWHRDRFISLSRLKPLLQKCERRCRSGFSRDRKTDTPVMSYRADSEREGF
jgi:hypothetical protein